MKQTVKTMIALLMAVLMMTVVLTACGDSKKSEAADNAADSAADSTPTQAEEEPTAAEDKEITGTAAEWGSYSVLVPEGFELKEAGEFSSYDFSVRKSDFSFFDFNTESDDDTMMQHYNYNKNTYINDQKDFEQTWGAYTWTGFQYSDGIGGYGFEAYTTIGEKIVRISAAGFTYDSAEATAVMSSLTVR